MVTLQREVGRSRQGGGWMGIQEVRGPETRQGESLGPNVQEIQSLHLPTALHRPPPLKCAPASIARESFPTLQLR